jgi:hypothetical protein
MARLMHEVCSEASDRLPHRSTANVDRMLVQQVYKIAQRKRKSHIYHDRDQD